MNASRIAVIGAGKMGQALIAGWLSSDVQPAAAIGPANICAVNPGAETRAYVQETYGVSCLEDASQLGAADLVVLAVKPQVMPTVLQTIAANGALVESAPLYVSIAAGISTKTIEDALGGQVHVVRVMPNTPLMVGAGASGVCAGAHATDEEVSYVRDLLACMGCAEVVDEADMDAVCAVSGSGPAYVDALIEAMRDGGVACGLDAALAEKLAVQTVYGAAKLILDTGTSPKDARLAVCSPGGTTLAGLDAMRKAGFTEAVVAGVSAADTRSKELGAC